jgi:3-hydroxyisobutyrate dehydrogenase-like beta-hydroxyacid dehydrogenase
MKVGFIGLGLMGNPMSKNILKKGFSLTVYNRSKEKTDELKSLGASVTSSPSELAQNSDVIITMVTAAKDVEEVLFGKNGAVNGAKPGSVIIDMSTIGPTAAKKIAGELKKNSIDFLDAPVTGSTPKAITGELTIFIGGDKIVFERVRPVFEAMGTNLQYIGKTGSGQAIKLVNNHLIAASIVALAEGMLLSDAMGLPREKAADVLKTVPAMSGFMNLKIPNYVKNEYPLLFSTANMTKDENLALSEARQAHKKLPVLENVVEVLKNTMKEFENEDFSRLIETLENK